MIRQLYGVSEYDEDIIQSCETVLQTAKLKGERRKATNKSRFEIVITYRAEADRDTTIITLNQVIQPEYEIWFCDWSFGNDTLAIVTRRRIR